jgi:hypothetical protein
MSWEYDQPCCRRSHALTTTQLRFDRGRQHARRSGHLPTAGPFGVIDVIAVQI